MWSSEVERLGKKNCSLFAYNIHALADYIGFFALLSLIIMIIIKFTTSYIDNWWYLLIPFFVGILGNIIFSYSWHLVSKKDFEYDYEKDEVKWIENGIEVIFNKNSMDKSK